MRAWIERKLRRMDVFVQPLKLTLADGSEEMGSQSLLEITKTIHEKDAIEKIRSTLKSEKSLKKKQTVDENPT